MPVSVDLIAVTFSGPKVGWAVGHDGMVLRSGDGGATWSMVMDGRMAAKLLVRYYSSQGPRNSSQIKAALDESEKFVAEQGARPFLDVYFSDEKTGYIVGAWGLILRTIDGGNTWEPWLHHVENPNAAHLYAVRKAAGALWIAGEQGVLLRSTNGGLSFESAKPPEGGSLFGVLEIPGNGVISFGLVGRAIISQDGGKTWAVSKGLGGSGLTSGTVLPDGRIVLVDGAAGLWISADQGKNFTAVRAQNPMSYSGVTWSEGLLHLVGLGGVRQASIPNPQ